MDTLFWHNYDTGEYEPRSSAPTTKEEWLPYISNWPGARELFVLLVDHMNVKPIDAARDVMTRMVGGNTVPVPEE